MEQECRLCIKPGNGSPKPDGTRMQALYPKGISAGHRAPINLLPWSNKIASEVLEVKADGLWNPEGSRPESVKVSNQVTTGV